MTSTGRLGPDRAVPLVADDVGTGVRSKRGLPVDGAWITAQTATLPGSWRSGGHERPAAVAAASTRSITSMLPIASSGGIGTGAPRRTAVENSSNWTA